MTKPPAMASTTTLSCIQTATDDNCSAHGGDYVSFSCSNLPDGDWKSKDYFWIRSQCFTNQRLSLDQQPSLATQLNPICFLTLNFFLEQRVIIGLGHFHRHWKFTSGEGFIQISWDLLSGHNLHINSFIYRHYSLEVVFSRYKVKYPAKKICSCDVKYKKSNMASTWLRISLFFWGRKKNLLMCCQYKKIKVQEIHLISTLDVP